MSERNQRRNRRQALAKIHMGAPKIRLRMRKMIRRMRKILAMEATRKRISARRMDGG